MGVAEAEESGLLKPEKKFPGRPVVLLPLPMAQVQSPVEELRSCKSCDEAKKKKEKVEQERLGPQGPGST